MSDPLFSASIIAVIINSLSPAVAFLMTLFMYGSDHFFQFVPVRLAIAIQREHRHKMYLRGYHVGGQFGSQLVQYSIRIYRLTFQHSIYARGIAARIMQCQRYRIWVARYALQVEFYF